MVEVVIGGVQKCGTTALHNYLVRHPNIFSGFKKELHFFDNVSIDWRRPDYSLLSAMFPEQHEGQMRLDASPSYIYLPYCLERLKGFNPQVRLIFIFRDPIQRAWSHWAQRTLKGRETLSFDEAILVESKRLASYCDGDIGYKEYAYLDRGYYGHQLARALSVFPAEQILCLRSEDLSEDPVRVLSRVATHLGIASFPEVTPIWANQGPGNPLQMTSETRSFIRAALREDNMRFAELSGLDIKHWETVRSL